MVFSMNRKKIMNITAALDLLNGMDEANNFLLLACIKFSDDQENFKTVSSAQKLLAQALTDLVFDLGQQLQGFSELPNPDKISNPLCLALEILSASGLAEKIKSFEKLIGDFQKIIDLARFYEEQRGFDIAGDFGDIKKLREKILLIKAEILR